MISDSELFHFLQREKIISKVQKSLEIIEHKNIDKANTLQKAVLEIDLNNQNLWALKCEDFPQNLRALESVAKKPEIIILNFKESFLDIIFIELKSKNWEFEDAKLKFENAFLWFLNFKRLFRDYKNQKLKFFGVIANQNSYQSQEYQNYYENLDIFEDKSKKFKTKTFFTKKEKLNIKLSEIYN